MNVRDWVWYVIGCMLNPTYEFSNQNVLSGTDDQIFLVLSAEEEAVLQEKVTFAEKVENEYTAKAHQKREKKTKRQTSRLQIHEILDTFAWSELPIAAQNFYLDLGWSQV